MSETLNGLPGTLCLMDDILVYGKTQAEHDQRLRKVLERVQQAGLTLSQEKCVISTGITQVSEVIQTKLMQLRR